MAGRKPFVAIIGGFWELAPSQRDEAKKLSRDIGDALAKAGFGLVVYFSNDESLEPHVVTGYVAATPSNASPGCIRVRYAASQKDTVMFREQATRSELFDRRIHATDDWEAPFYRSLVETDGVDAVLLVAGARSVLIAGQVAVGRELPLLAIEKFDGSAKVIWRELANKTKDYPSSSTATSAELVGWLKGQCVRQALRREEAANREQAYLRSTSLVRVAWFTAAAAIALLFALFMGTSKMPSPANYTAITFAGLLAAGATGALARALIWGAKNAALTSLFLGALAGVVVGAAYLIPQWIGAPGVLDAANNEVTATDKIQFVSAILVALSAGVGFDTVFNRLKTQAEALPIKAGS